MGAKAEAQMIIINCGPNVNHPRPRRAFTLLLSSNKTVSRNLFNLLPSICLVLKVQYNCHETRGRRRVGKRENLFNFNSIAVWLRSIRLGPSKLQPLWPTNSFLWFQKRFSKFMMEFSINVLKKTKKRWENKKRKIVLKIFKKTFTASMVSELWARMRHTDSRTDERTINNIKWRRL